MGLRQDLTSEELCTIKAYKQLKMSNRHIAQLMGIHHTTVVKVMSRLDQNGNPTTNRKKRCKRKLTPRVTRRICNLFTRDAAGRRRSDLDVSRELQLSRATVQRARQTLGLKSCRALKKPLITEVNRRKRLAFAKAHIHWSIERWRRVLFTVESRFCLHSDAPQIVKRRTTEALNKDCIQTTIKFGGGSVMVWAGISGVGCTQLVEVDCRLNAARYCSLLHETLLPFIAQREPTTNIILQQDNAPCHAARLTTKWLQDHAIETLQWPPQSPDINPIENVWGMLKHHLKNVITRSKAEKLQVLDTEWKRIIATDVVKNLVESVPRRLQAIIRANGNHTQY